MKTLIYLLVFCSFMLTAMAKEKKEISWFEPGSGKAGTEVIIGIKGFNTTDNSIAVYFGSKEALISKKNSDHLVVSVPAGSFDGPITIKDESGQISSSSIFLTGTKSISPVLLKVETADAPSSKKLLSIKADEIITEGNTPVVQETGKKVEPCSAILPETGKKASHILKTQKAIIPDTDVAVVAVKPEKTEHIIDNGKLPVANTDAQPLILGFQPKSGPAGTSVKITGLNFGFDKNAISVSLKNGTQLIINAVYDQFIEVTIPQGVHQSGSLTVTVNGRKSVSRGSFKMQ